MTMEYRVMYAQHYTYFAGIISSKFLPRLCALTAVQCSTVRRRSTGQAQALQHLLVSRLQCLKITLGSDEQQEENGSVASRQGHQLIALRELLLSADQRRRPLERNG